MVFLLSLVYLHPSVIGFTILYLCCLNEPDDALLTFYSSSHPSVFRFPTWLPSVIYTLPLGISLMSYGYHPFCFFIHLSQESEKQGFFPLRFLKPRLLQSIEYVPNSTVQVLADAHGSHMWSCGQERLPLLLIYPPHFIVAELRT